jgi:uncharacterized alkaline shock family protein YloU
MMLINAYPCSKGSNAYRGKQMVTEPLGVVRVARQVLITIVVNAALQIPGVVHIAHKKDQWSRLLGREIPRHGVVLTIQEEVASAIEEMVGMQVREVNVYIQDVA